MGKGAGFPDPHEILLLPMGGGRLAASDPVSRLGLMPGSVADVSILVFRSVYIPGRMEGFALLGVRITLPQALELTLGLGAGGIRREN